MMRNNLGILVALLLGDQLLISIVQSKGLAVDTGRFFQFASPLVFIISAIGIWLALYFLIKLKTLTHTAFIIISAGWLSNVISYARFGRMIDYIPTGISYINTADLMIVAGGIWLLWNLRD